MKLDEMIVAMGRVVGDGGLNFEIVDVAVDPEHHGRGIGRLIMEQIMGFMESSAPQGAYITLMADVPVLYEKFGFTLTEENAGTQWGTRVKEQKFILNLP